MCHFLSRNTDNYNHFNTKESQQLLEFLVVKQKPLTHGDDRGKKTLDIVGGTSYL